MKFINKKMAIAINKLVIKLSGGTIIEGSNNILNSKNLGFIEMIFTNELFGTKLYPDIFHMASAYLFFIIKNHIFIDGNKRTALAVCITFLELNNIALSPLSDDETYDFVVGVTEGENIAETQIPRIASWLKERCLY